MKTVTLADLIEAAYLQSDLSRREAEEVVRGTFSLIADTLVAGEEVKVSTFGNFFPVQKRERMGRNPRRPEEQHIIAARRVVTFRPMRELRFKVARGDG